MENVIEWLNQQCDALGVPADPFIDDCGDAYPQDGARVVVHLHPDDLQSFKDALFHRLLPPPDDPWWSRERAADWRDEPKRWPGEKPPPFPRATIDLNCRWTNKSGAPVMELAT